MYPLCAPLIVVVLLAASRRCVGGPLIACAAGAILSFAALWLFSGSTHGLLVFAGPRDTAASLRFPLHAVSNVTWVLALYPAALACQARWLDGLAAAQVVANAALLNVTNPTLSPLAA